MQRKTKTPTPTPPPQTGKWNQSNVRPDLESWHERNLLEGFIFFRVGISNQSTPEQIVTIQNKIKTIDEKANQVDAKTGKRIPNQKPYFRYTMIEPDGSEKPLGGGWYLYSGWADTDDPRYHKNSKEDLKGKQPVYFRAKSAVHNSKVPNFSIQWNKVHRFYYKFPVADNETQQFIAGNKIIRMTGFK